MATIDGKWTCEVDSPMGAQQLDLNVTSQPDGSFTGTASGPLGAINISDGQLLGDTLRFKLAISMPFPMTLDAEAKLVGDDRIEGTVDTGAFGRYPMRATRAG
jgi:hypothetical protein